MVVVVAGTSAGAVVSVPAVASTEPGWDAVFFTWVVVVVLEEFGVLVWWPWPFRPRWSPLAPWPPVVDVPAAVVVGDPPEEITDDDVGVVVGTGNGVEAASLLAELSDVGEVGAEEGMAAGTPTAMTATAAAVPPNMTHGRLPGSGEEPMSHRPHSFMACSQLFMP